MVKILSRFCSFCFYLCSVLFIFVTVLFYTYRGSVFAFFPFSLIFNTVRHLSRFLAAQKRFFDTRRYLSCFYLRCAAFLHAPVLISSFLLVYLIYLSSIFLSLYGYFFHTQRYFLRFLSRIEPFFDTWRYLSQH